MLSTVLNIPLLESQCSDGASAGVDESLHLAAALARDVAAEYRHGAILEPHRQQVLKLIHLSLLCFPTIKTKNYGKSKKREKQ